MPDYNDAMLNVIDARIAAHSRIDKVMATCVDDSSDAGVDVIFDGASVSVPVKVAGGTRCFAQDRVMVQLYGATWVVTNSYSPEMRNVWTKNTVATASTTTSGTYVNMGGPITIDYEKHYSTSALLVSVQTSMWVTTASAQFALGVNIDSFGAVGDIDMFRMTINALSTHTPTGGYRILGAEQGPHYTTPVAGSYTATLRWARIAGTGTLTQDATDWVAFMIEEIF